MSTCLKASSTATILQTLVPTWPVAPSMGHMSTLPSGHGGTHRRPGLHAPHVGCSDSHMGSPFLDQTRGLRLSRRGHSECLHRPPLCEARVRPEHVTDSLAATLLLDTFIKASPLIGPQTWSPVPITSPPWGPFPCCHSGDRLLVPKKSKQYVSFPTVAGCLPQALTNCPGLGAPGLL